MAEFTITREVAAPARAVFDRLLDWDAHSAAIPLTRLSHSGTPAVGQRFVARTGWRRLGFDDPMVVELLRPPAGDAPGDLGGVVEVAKRGRVVAGTVRWSVTPTGTGTRVEWRQRLVLPWLPGFLDPVAGRVARLAYAAGLGRLLR
jgi:hypothetical protein